MEVEVAALGTRHVVAVLELKLKSIDTTTARCQKGREETVAVTQTTAVGLGRERDTLRPCLAWLKPCTNVRCTDATTALESFFGEAREEWKSGVRRRRRLASRSGR